MGKTQRVRLPYDIYGTLIKAQTAMILVAKWYSGGLKILVMQVRILPEKMCLVYVIISSAE